eukprot:g4664.t1
MRAQKQRLANERLANKELGRRVAALRKECASWRKKYEEEHARRLQLDGEVGRLRALLDGSQDGNNPSTENRRLVSNSTTPSRAGALRIERCVSPKIGRRIDKMRSSFEAEAVALRRSVEEEDDEEKPPQVPVRTSIEFLLRSSMRGSPSEELRPEEPSTTTNCDSPASSLACGFFIAGATSEAATNAKLHISRGTIFGRAEPVILSSEVLPSLSKLPDLISNMCYPNGVRLWEKDDNSRASKRHRSSFSPSLFSVAVPSDSGADNPPLYGIFAQIDPGGKLSCIEHSTGRVLQLPFIACFLTREPKFEALSEVIKEIANTEVRRMASRVDSLHCGKMSDDAIHIQGSGFGKLCPEASALVRDALGLDAEHQRDPIFASVIARCRPSLYREHPQCLFAWGGARLIRAISLERTLVVLGCALAETKIVFVSPNTSILGSSVLAFSALLMPLVWSGPLVPVLPTSLLHMLDAPFPLMAGITRLNKSMLEQRENDTVIVDLDRGRIFLPTEISSAFHNYKFKNLEKFCADNHHLEQALEQPKCKTSGSWSDSPIMVLHDAIRGEVRRLVSNACGEKRSAESLEAYEESSPLEARLRKTQMMSYFKDTKMTAN